MTALTAKAVHAVPSADEHPAAVYLARLGVGSRETMHQALDTIASLATGGGHDAASLPWEELRYQHTTAIRTELMETYAPATTNKMLSALRGALKEAWRLGLMSAEDYNRAADLKSVKGSTLPKGRALSQGEVGKLLEDCKDGSVGGTRDAALLAILCTAGLRRAELVGLNLSDYNREDDSLVVRGKGRKERLVYVLGAAADLLDKWRALRGEEEGPIFCAVQKSGKICIRRLTPGSVLYVLKKRARRAGVESFSPHDLRRTFISNLLDAGADIVSVQQLAGHARVETTARYDRRGEEAKKKAAGLLSLP